MGINELYVLLNDKFNDDDLTGELTINDNYILWSCDIDSCDFDEISNNDEDEDDFDLDNNYNFDGTSNEELLMDMYLIDNEKLIEFITDTLNIIIDTTEPKTTETNISFKIFI